MDTLRFLTRKLNQISAQMSLNVLACNLKRVMKTTGACSLLQILALECS